MYDGSLAVKVKISDITLSFDVRDEYTSGSGSARGITVGWQSSRCGGKVKAPGPQPLLRHSLHINSFCMVCTFTL